MVMKEWQPIETAPKGGTRVRLLIPYSPEKFSEAECTDEGEWEPLLSWEVGRVELAGLIPDWAYKQNGCWRYDGDDGCFDIQPTHWQPLPEPPKAGES